MNFPRSLSCIALALTLSLASALPTHAASATTQLQFLDKTTYSGDFDFSVDLYSPPGKDGKYAAPTRYPAQLLFERPDRFRLVLRPGAKNEYRAVVSGGVAQWRDLGTGLSGKAAASAVTDPLALGLLGSAGEMLRFTASKDIVTSPSSKISGARLTPNTWGSGVVSGLVWLSSDGKPLSFEFLLSDRSKVLISVLRFRQNVATKPGDFQI